ncbi:hypothetical protein MRB53_041748 [Persea americana]|nr:hypothetical protein MRB53_041748 [Persea americana]
MSDLTLTCTRADSKLFVRQVGNDQIRNEKSEWHPNTKSECMDLSLPASESRSAFATEDSDLGAAVEAIDETPAEPAQPAQPVQPVQPAQPGQFQEPHLQDHGLNHSLSLDHSLYPDHSRSLNHNLVLLTIRTMTASVPAGGHSKTFHIRLAREDSFDASQYNFEDVPRSGGHHRQGSWEVYDPINYGSPVPTTAQGHDVTDEELYEIMRLESLEPQQTPEELAIEAQLMEIQMLQIAEDMTRNRGRHRSQVLISPGESALISSDCPSYEAPRHDIFILDRIQISLHVDLKRSPYLQSVSLSVSKAAEAVLGKQGEGGNPASMNCVDWRRLRCKGCVDSRHGPRANLEADKNNCQCLHTSYFKTKQGPCDVV